MAATPITPPQPAGAASYMFACEFPAATTTTAPRATTVSIASCKKIGATTGLGAQAHVQDPGRVGVRRDARNRESACPDHAIDHVGERPAAFTQHPHGQNLRAPRHAGNAGPIVGGRGDDSRDKRSVPGAALRAAFVLIRRGVAGSVGSLSRPSPSFAAAGSEMKSKPGNIFPARSGCCRMPVSMTATVTGAPVVTFHAAGALIPDTGYDKFHCWTYPGSSGTSNGTARPTASA